MENNLRRQKKESVNMKTRELALATVMLPELLTIKQKGNYKAEKRIELNDQYKQP